MSPRRRLSGRHGFGCHQPPASRSTSRELGALQPASFVPVTLAYSGIGLGEAELGLQANVLGDGSGQGFAEPSFGPSLNVTVTPVPAALPLLATALVGLGLLAWRRRPG